jgi:hypothetical protein
MAVVWFTTKTKADWMRALPPAPSGKMSPRTGNIPIAVLARTTLSLLDSAV